MGVFQTTFSFSLHFTGRPVASEWPVPLGPRNCGQLSPAAAMLTARQAETSTIKLLRMGWPRMLGHGCGWHRVGGHGINSEGGHSSYEPVYPVARQTKTR